MGERYQVIFTGELKPGVDRQQFIKDFAQRIKSSEEKVTAIIDSGKPVTMKNDLEREQAESFRDILEGLGMSITIAPMHPEVQQPSAEPSTPTPTESSQAHSSRSEDENNPYQAPTAELQRKAGEMSGPVTVPVGHGMSWIGDAYRNHFKANIGSWIGVTIVLFGVNIVLNLIPFLGSLAYMLIAPVLTAGIMLGAREQEQGGDFNVGHLFRGFKEAPVGQLMLVGLFYMLGFIIIIAIVFAVMGSTMGMFQSPDLMADTQALAATDPLMALLPFLVMMLLIVPLIMAYWFAPALVALDNVSAVSAMKLSFSGCLKNILPFLIYGIVMTILMIIATIPFLLGWLVMFPVMFASMYTSYRDIYYPEVQSGSK